MNIHGIIFDIPTDVQMNNYPYQMVYKEVKDDVTNYMGVFTSKPICYNPTDNLYEVNTPYDFVILRLNENSLGEVIGQDNSETENGGALLAIMTCVQLAQVAFWINHDVLNKETGEIHLKSYNNVLLPPIPASIDRTQFPYAYIIKMQEIENPSYIEYTLMVLSKPMQTNSDGTNVMVAGTSGFGGFMVNQYEWGVQETGEVPSDMPMEQEGYVMTMIWSESPSTKYYLLTESEVKGIADSIRRKTGKTDLITLENMPSEIDGISSGGLENGYDVMFCDENSKELAFYSIKSGHTINPPVYECKKWLTEDGTIINFPYTPSTDVVLYANNEGYDGQLYEHFSVDKAIYPYVAIQIYYGTATIYFSKSASNVDNDDMSMSDVLYNNCQNCPNEDASAVIGHVIANITTLKTSSKYNIWQQAESYLYSNFDTQMTAGTLYRLD